MNKMNKILLAIIIILTICLSAMTYYYVKAKTGYDSLMRTYLEYTMKEEV